MSLRLRNVDVNTTMYTSDIASINHVDKPVTKYGVATPSRTILPLRDPHVDQEHPISVNQDLSRIIVKHIVLAYSATVRLYAPGATIQQVSSGFNCRDASISPGDSLHCRGSKALLNFPRLRFTLVIYVMKQKYNIAVSE